MAVSELLGHDNAVLVLVEVYAHLMPGGEDLARKAIDSAWNGETPTAQGRPG